MSLERPGWRKEQDTNFWIPDQAAVYWQTPEGHSEALRLWGALPAWLNTPGSESGGDDWGPPSGIGSLGNNNRTDLFDTSARIGGRGFTTPGDLERTGGGGGFLDNITGGIGNLFNYEDKNPGNWVGMGLGLLTGNPFGSFIGDKIGGAVYDNYNSDEDKTTTDSTTPGNMNVDYRGVLTSDPVGLAGVGNVPGQGGYRYGNVGNVGWEDPNNEGYNFGGREYVDDYQGSGEAVYDPNYDYSQAASSEGGNSANYNTGGGDNYGMTGEAGSGFGGFAEGTDAEDAASADAGYW
jgi:hypothetical protein